MRCIVDRGALSNPRHRQIPALQQQVPPRRGPVASRKLRAGEVGGDGILKYITTKTKYSRNSTLC